MRPAIGPSARPRSRDEMEIAAIGHLVGGLALRFELATFDHRREIVYIKAVAGSRE